MERLIKGVIQSFAGALTAAVCLLLLCGVVKVIVSSEQIIDQNSHLQGSYERWLFVYGVPAQLEIYQAAQRTLIEVSEHILGDSFASKLLIEWGTELLFIGTVAIPLTLVALLVFVSARGGMWTMIQSSDLLGKCTNGRLFFSGLKASVPSGLKKNVYAAPISTLFTPKRASPAEAWETELCKFLEEEQLLNKTTLELVRMIVAYKNLPAFIPDTYEADFYSKRVAVLSLLQTTEISLRTALTLQVAHRDSINHVSRDERDTPLRIEANDYQRMLERGLRRTLDNQASQVMKESVRPLVVATLVLARAVGQAVTTCVDKNGTASRNSLFPELNARAALQSIIAFQSEFTPAEQTDLRRALALSARHWALGPVKFPMGLSDETLALRQWSELLFVQPLELLTAADDIELHGLRYQAHRRWGELIYERVRNFDRELIQESVITSGGIILVRLSTLVRLFRIAVDERAIRRADELLSVVDLKEKIREKRGGKYTEDTSSAQRNHSIRRFDAPLSLSELRELGLSHSLKLQDLKDWSVLKGILGSNGWLARRVGDLAVPATGVVFISSMIQGTRVGKAGMVALRDDRLKERFGDNWRNRFNKAEGLQITTSRASYDRTLSGIEISEEEDDDNAFGELAEVEGDL